METVLRLQLNGARMKAVFHRGLTMEVLGGLWLEIHAARSLDDLCSSLRSRGPVSIIVESTRTIPQLFSALSHATRRCSAA